ncbi:SHOCT domain-containing protein [Mycobacterium shimoidei]|uniref:SHOCT domain-containing protein n=1 Tax=Mycobacterium shimoidei TaxID=29313 RepID=A0A1E3TFR8_MYCSH|nr:SHOCT domain-containing protein [Mycobacterium shimoidei]MCV7261260.1 SHOCT domain-containing protein [Mycobacterium shimoidei]ODR13151.1 hypothetical protein BHQ16_11750 [Mycobacterium shimoidei]ORW78500.1 hypothetical protein AWC26_17545 [Mycobacterium shimoidei]SRX94783.1 hypothetical protein MSP7336_03044 [Mycobacterium shimoidei]
MNAVRVGSRIGLVVSVLTLIVAVGGFITSLILNAFVFGKYNAYGEVPIPGSGSLHLPEGEVTVSFHTQVVGSPSGGGLPIPGLKMGIDPPAGVPEPVVTENVGSTTTVNNDSHVRVWTVRVPADGTYQIRTDGQVGGFISPRLAFGHGSPYGWLPWMFVGWFVIGLAGLTLSVMSTLRSRRAPRPVSTAEQSISEVPDWSAAAPDEQAIRLEQLKTLTALRDSGALTEKEFDDEKRRILDGR